MTNCLLFSLLFFPLVTSVKSKGVISTSDQLGTSTSLAIKSEGLAVLDALTVIIRSIHNCRVFGHYGGIPKLTALMKGIFILFLGILYMYIYFRTLKKCLGCNRHIFFLHLVGIFPVVSSTFFLCDPIFFFLSSNKK